MHTKSRRLSDPSSRLGFGLALLGAWLLIYQENLIAWPMLATGLVILFAGFCFYVKAKGYHPGWVLLFFLFDPVLFFVFFFLPDRHESK